MTEEIRYPCATTKGIITRNIILRLESSGMAENLRNFEENLFNMVLVNCFWISRNDLFTKIRYSEEVSHVLVDIFVTLCIHLAVN